MRPGQIEYDRWTGPASPRRRASRTLSSKALTFRSCAFIGEICGEHFGELRASYCEVREWIVLMMCLGSTFEMILPGLT